MSDRGIEAVFFDFGGVILKTFDGIDHDGIEARFGLEAKSLRKCMYAESRYADYQVGACTHEDWLDSIRQALERMLGGNADHLMDAWQNSERAWNFDTIELVRRLRAARYKTGIISNTIPGMLARMEELDGARQPDDRLIPLFDVIVGSGDLGIAKPDSRIFQHALDALGVEPQASVFTDDYSKHAEGARAVGMHGFLFTTCKQLERDLRTVGVSA